MDCKPPVICNSVGNIGCEVSSLVIQFLTWKKPCLWVCGFESQLRKLQSLWNTYILLLMNIYLLNAFRIKKQKKLMNMYIAKKHVSIKFNLLFSVLIAEKPAIHIFVTIKVPYKKNCRCKNNKTEECSALKANFATYF